MEQRKYYPLSHHWNLVSLVLGLLLSALPLTAWSALEAATATPVISEQQAIGLALNRIETGKEAITVTNRRHRALFDRRGVQFTPHRGPDWNWRLTHINNARQAAVAPTRSAPDAVDFARAGLIERYLIKAATIEQRFVLERPWPLDRDLVITGAINSKGKMEPTGQGWVWRDASGVVTLGQVTVFDATGKVLPARMQVTDTHSTIQVAAADLAGAVYPVTVDPEIGTNDFRISDMGTDGNPLIDASEPAVAYNATANQYLVVWAGDDDTGLLMDDEFEIYGQLLDAAGMPVPGTTNDFRISDMGTDGNALIQAFSPAVAYNATANQYLVVWAGDDDTGLLMDDEFEIYGQLLDAAGMPVPGTTNDFRISDMGTDGNPLIDASEPAVAYNATANQYLVVWAGDDDTAPLMDDEFEIYGQLLDAAGMPVPGTTNDFRISDMGTDGNPLIDASTPAVAYNTTANQYLVVWAGDDDTAPLMDDEFEIYGQLLDAAGMPVPGTTNDFRISDMGTDGNPLIDASEPAVAYNATANQYLVVWAGDDDTAPLMDDEFEIYGQLLDAAGMPVPGTTNDFRISDMGTDGNALIQAFDPTVAWNLTANEYLVVWEADDDTGPLMDGEFEIYGQRIDAAGNGIGTNDFRLSDMGADGNPLIDAFNPAVAWNLTANEYLVVWEGDDDTAPLMDEEFEIFGQLFSPVTTGGGGGVITGGGSSGSGHCSLASDDAAFDPTLWLLVLVSVIYLGRRRLRA